MKNEKEIKKIQDQLKDELRNKKNELKEKQSIFRKQEKHLKEQHEAYIKIDEKCRRLQKLIDENKSGLSPNKDEEVTDEDIKTVEEEIKMLEQTQIEEKQKYKQMIKIQEESIKELTTQLDALNLELKQKDQQCRLNALKINELKRQTRIKPSPNNLEYKEFKNFSKNIESMKRDMEAEKEMNSGGLSSDKVENVEVKEIQEMPKQNPEVKDIELSKSAISTRKKK